MIVIEHEIVNGVVDRIKSYSYGRIPEDLYQYDQSMIDDGALEDTCTDSDLFNSNEMTYCGGNGFKIISEKSRFS